MPGYIEDRWLKKKPDPKTGKREPTEQGLKKIGKRYKVAGIPGVRARSFHRLEDAKAWLKQAATDSSRGEFVDPRRGDILLADYILKEWWPSRTDKLTTGTAMESRIRNHILEQSLGQTALNQINGAILRTWKADLLTRVEGSAEVIWVHLSTILNAAVDDGRLLRNPCTANRSVKPPKRHNEKAKALPRATVDALRSHVQERYELAVDLGVGAGLRQGEVFGLGEDDFDFELGVVHVLRQVQWSAKGRPYFCLPKGDKTRDVPIPPNLAARVRAHFKRFPPVATTLPWSSPVEPTTELEKRQRRPITVNLVLTTSQGLRIKPSTWNDCTWKPALAKAGLIAVIPSQRTAAELRSKSGSRKDWEPSRELGFHVLRHTFASTQLEAGESIVTLSKWLGHASPNITLEHYAHFMPGAGERGLAAMDAWFAPLEMDLPRYSLGPQMITGESIKLMVSAMMGAKVDMKVKYKETSRGGLAVNVIEC